MTTYFVRPYNGGSNYGTGDGLSYANAKAQSSTGLISIGSLFPSFTGGDTVYLCDTFTAFNNTNSQSACVQFGSLNGLTSEWFVRGDYPSAPCIIDPRQGTYGGANGYVKVSMMINGCANGTFDGFTIYGSGRVNTDPTTGWGNGANGIVTSSGNGSKKFKIRNCTLIGGGVEDRVAIDLVPQTDAATNNDTWFEVYNNTIYGWLKGIEVEKNNTSGEFIKARQNCLIYNNTIYGGSHRDMSYVDGFGSSGYWDYRLICYNNDISGWRQDGMDGLGSRNIVFIGNYLHDSGAYVNSSTIANGFKMGGSGGGNHLYLRNILQRVRGHAFTTNSWGAGRSGIAIGNIADTCGSGLMLNSAGDANVVFVNNTVLRCTYDVNNDVGGSEPSGYAISGYNAGSSNTIANNILHGYLGYANNQGGTWTLTNCATIGTAQGTVTLTNCLSIADIDSLALTSDYRLTSSSTLIGAGTAIQSCRDYTDYLGQTFYSAPSIGAIEYLRTRGIRS